MNDDHYDPKRDQPSERTIESHTPGNPFRLKLTDPYSFWSVHRDKGQVPAKLQGSYTSYDRAALAVQTYLKEVQSEIEKSATNSQAERRPAVTRPVQAV